MQKFGIISLGHAPRKDITDGLRQELPDHVEIVEDGALGGFDTAEEVQSVAGQIDDRPPFVTKLSNDVEVLLNREDMARLIQKRVHDLENDVMAIGILCTGAFPEFDSSVPILETGELLRSWAKSIAPNGTVGVLVPIESQIELAVQEFEGMTTVPAAASPYAGGDEVLQAAEEIGNDVDLVVLKCMSFDYQTKQTVREVTEVPTLVPQFILAKTMDKML
jgi:protein AroM